MLCMKQTRTLVVVRLAENAIDWFASFPGDYENEYRRAECEYDRDA